MWEQQEGTCDAGRPYGSALPHRVSQTSKLQDANSDACALLRQVANPTDHDRHSDDYLARTPLTAPPHSASSIARMLVMHLDHTAELAAVAEDVATVAGHFAR